MKKKREIFMKNSGLDFPFKYIDSIKKKLKNVY